MNTALPRQVEILLLTSVALITLPHIEHVPPLLFAFFNLMLAMRFAAVWKPHWLPNSPLLLLLTLTGIGLLYIHHQGILGRDAGTGIFVTALGLKLLEVKSGRDAYLSVFLAFIVAATQFLYLQNIFMAGYILAVCCVLVATLICLNTPQPRPLSALKSAAAIVLQALPLAMVMFVFFPRVEAPRWMMFQDKPKARIGLNDVLEPGSISELGLSDELVFRVKFDGPLPESAQRYWRGPVFSDTDGKRWTESKHTVFKRYLDRPRFTGMPYRYTLLMEPQEKKWIFALDMPAEFPPELERNAVYQLITEKNPETRAEYKIVSYPHYNTGYITKTEYRDNLQLPGEPSVRIRELVEQLHGFDRQPEAYIDNLLKHFRSKRFYYTLRPPLMEENPIETFLFETRRGFCSHYATATAYLLRVAGIPARVVGGYQGGELNTAGNFLEIRQAHAHAWTEAWLYKRGWVRIDPTAAIAPERVRRDINIERQIAQGEVNFTPLTADDKTLSWLKQATDLWNNIDYNWQRWVINYGSYNQSRLLEFFNARSFVTLGYWLALTVALATAPIAWLLLRSKTRQSDKAVQLYRIFCRKLAKRGLVRKAQEGARDFSLRACTALPDNAAAIERITGLYIAIRYAQNPPPDTLQALRTAVRGFRA
ncbi:MAG: transglutaminase TgpA family protein [Gammaproteobacteria bacterium]